MVFYSLTAVKTVSVPRGWDEGGNCLLRDRKVLPKKFGGPRFYQSSFSKNGLGVAEHPLLPSMFNNFVLLNPFLLSFEDFFDYGIIN